MWRFFRKFGNVVDVFVPQKRTKLGRRFGFVRFKGVNDEHKLVDLITEAWGGNDSFVVNRAKFERQRVGRPSYMQKSIIWFPVGNLPSFPTCMDVLLTRRWCAVGI